MKVMPAPGGMPILPVRLGIAGGAVTQSICADMNK
jgi:hypothetical protein